MIHTFIKSIPLEVWICIGVLLFAEGVQTWLTGSGPIKKMGPIFILLWCIIAVLVVSSDKSLLEFKMMDSFFDECPTVVWFLAGTLLSALGLRLRFMSARWPKWAGLSFLLIGSFIVIKGFHYSEHVLGHRSGGGRLRSRSLPQELGEAISRKW